MADLKIRIVDETGSNEFAELTDRGMVQGELRGIALYPNGTSEGRHAVGFFIELADGSVVHAQTTGRLLLAAAAALRGSMARVGETEGEWKQ